VHLVPHTHDDAGWLKTVDEYFAGQNNSIQNANVQYILDSVIKSLAENPDRRFVYVEQAFFQRWWRMQDETVKTLTRKLVKNGQLEMINGAWVMHCEATPHYVDMIDQTSLGHKFLFQEFGVSPKIGWQIDPFGHSATQAALLSAEAGFVGLFFGRIDFQDLAIRVNAEFVWRASPSLGPSAQVFTGLTGSYHGNYGPPSGFNWDIFSSDEPIQDNPALENYNVKSRIDDFVTQALWQAEHTRGDNIMMTMGSDFQYQAANNWFSNLDKLIHYVNLDGRINAFYSTPETYVAAKAKENVSWPLKTDDFFPYADGPHQFWTGYFISRPNLKGMVRDVSGFYQVAKQISSLSGQSASQELEPLAEAMGLIQHHDAVAGTAKQHATFDYAKRLSAAETLAEDTVADALSAIAGIPPAQFKYCKLLNVSVCAVSQQVGTGNSDTLAILVWNGLAQERIEIIEIPVTSPAAQVSLTSNGVTSSPVQQVTKSLESMNDYGHPAGGAPYTLTFQASLPAVGFTSYDLKDTSAASRKAVAASTVVPAAVLENEFVRLEVCEDTSRICKLTYKQDKTTAEVQVDLDQDWFWYKSSTGIPDNAPGNSQVSGAYIFRPNVSEAERIFTGQPTVTLVKGELFDELLMDFGPVISQRVRLAKGERHVEFTYTVKEIPIEDGWGKEVVSRFTTSIKSDGNCWTDSNGREMQARKRDFRPTWQLHQTESVAGNYFPVNAALFIRDSDAQLTVLTDRSQGGTGCSKDGVLELMVTRRALVDDRRGVGEPLNETEFVTDYASGPGGGQHYGAGLVTRGKHFVQLAAPARASAMWRPLQDRVYVRARPFLLPGGLPASARQSFSALSAALPPNLQIITMETLSQNVMLLRLGHQFGVSEDAVLSQPSSLKLSTLFKHLSVTGIEEMALTAQAPRSEVLERRISWKIDGEAAISTSACGAASKALAQGEDEVTLGPLQIRTFRITFALASDMPQFI